VAALWTSFLVVALAEMGDKMQLLAPARDHRESGTGARASRPRGWSLGMLAVDALVVIGLVPPHGADIPATLRWTAAALCIVLGPIALAR
jgi:putative Ca2+/H+ antiporter (TMEM165/GDT1 family)